MHGLNCQQLVSSRSKDRASVRKKFTAPATRPSRLLDAPVDPVLDLLEQLDDVVFEAIRGCKTSMAKAVKLWPKTINWLGWEAVEESREQYLRVALDVTHFTDDLSDPTNRGFRSPEQSLVAWEVIELLTRE